MKQIKAMIDELREKRLWPVAVLLLAGLIAVPVLLTKNSSATPTPVAQLPSSSAPQSPVPGQPVVSASTAPSHSNLRGPARDPFSQQTGPASTSASSTGSTGTAATGTGATGSTSSTGTTGGTSTASSGGSSSSTTSASSGSASSGSTTSGSSTPPSGSTTAPKVTYYAFRVDLRFGRTGSVRRYGNVQRLSPVPNTTNPVLIFLGVKEGGKTAVFLTASLAAPSGKGTCTPSAQQCEYLSLKVGQPERVLALNPRGSWSEYTVEVTKIHLRAMKTAVEAARARGQYSRAGAKLIAHARKVMPAAHLFDFSAGTGLLSQAQIPATGPVSPLAGGWVTQLAQATDGALTAVGLEPTSDH